MTEAQGRAYAVPRPAWPRAGPALIPLVLLAAVACGRTVPTRQERVVRVTAPSHPPASPVLELLPTPEPTPTPTPAPQTPPPTPRPTRKPMPAPGGATLTARGTEQPGSTGGFCWNANDGRRAVCATPDPAPPESGLSVTKGEEVLLRLHADAAPDDEIIRPFQGSREGYPAQRMDPSLETRLRMDLDPGEWLFEVCATWRGYGNDACWLFRLTVQAP